MDFYDIDQQPWFQDGDFLENQDMNVYQTNQDIMNEMDNEVGYIQKKKSKTLVKGQRQSVDSEENGKIFKGPKAERGHWSASSSWFPPGKRNQMQNDDNEDDAWFAIYDYIDDPQDTQEREEEEFINYYEGRKSASSTLENGGVDGKTTKEENMRNVKTRIVDNFVNIDSKSRNKRLYPYANDYEVYLDREYTNVKEIRIVSSQIPNLNKNIYNDPIILKNDTMIWQIFSENTERVFDYEVMDNQKVIVYMNCVDDRIMDEIFNHDSFSKLDQSNQQQSGGVSGDFAPEGDLIKMYLIERRKSFQSNNFRIRMEEFVSIFSPSNAAVAVEGSVNAVFQSYLDKLYFKYKYNKIVKVLKNEELNGLYETIGFFLKFYYYGESWKDCLVLLGVEILYNGARNQKARRADNFVSSSLVDHLSNTYSSSETASSQEGYESIRKMMNAPKAIFQMFTQQTQMNNTIPRHEAVISSGLYDDVRLSFELSNKMSDNNYLMRVTVNEFKNESGFRCYKKRFLNNNSIYFRPYNWFELSSVSSKSKNSDDCPCLLIETNKGDKYSRKDRGSLLQAHHEKRRYIVFVKYLNHKFSENDIVMFEKYHQNIGFGSNFENILKNSLYGREFHVHLPMMSSRIDQETGEYVFSDKRLIDIVFNDSEQVIFPIIHNYFFIDLEEVYDRDICRNLFSGQDFFGFRYHMSMSLMKKYEKVFKIHAAMSGLGDVLVKHEKIKLILSEKFTMEKVIGMPKIDSCDSFVKKCRIVNDRGVFDSIKDLQFSVEGVKDEILRGYSVVAVDLKRLLQRRQLYTQYSKIGSSTNESNNIDELKESIIVYSVNHNLKNYDIISFNGKLNVLINYISDDYFSFKLENASLNIDLKNIKYDQSTNDGDSTNNTNNVSSYIHQKLYEIISDQLNQENKLFFNIQPVEYLRDEVILKQEDILYCDQSLVTFKFVGQDLDISFFDKFLKDDNIFMCDMYGELCFKLIKIETNGLFLGYSVVNLLDNKIVRNFFNLEGNNKTIILSKRRIVKLKYYNHMLETSLNDVLIKGYLPLDGEYLIYKKDKDHFFIVSKYTSDNYVYKKYSFDPFQLVITSDYHGFNSEITNKDLFGNTNTEINFESFPYIFCCSKILGGNLVNIYNNNNSKNFDQELTNIFCKFNMPEKLTKDQRMVYDRHAMTFKTFSLTPLSSLSKIDFQFYYPNGLLYDFQNIDHSFTLLIREYVDTNIDTGFSTKRGNTDDINVFQSRVIPFMS